MKIASINYRKSAEKLIEDENAPQKGHFPLMFLHDQAEAGSAENTHQLGATLAEWLPLNILVVDDAEVNQLLVAKMLEKMGYKPTIVSNGQEAFDAVMKANYELVLMDLYMPEMSGTEATRMIKENLEDESPIIIGITSSIFDDELSEGQEAGIDDYIKKPFRAEDLINKLSHWEKELRIKIKN